MKKNLLAIILLIIFSWVGLLLAANQWYFWYWVSSTLSIAKLNQSAGSAAAISTTIPKIEEHGICKTITSTDTKLLFVPTKTATERSTFITNKPSHITLGTCGCTTNADCTVGQICSWYVAGANSCQGSYESTSFWCVWKSIPDSSPPYVCMKSGEPYQLVPADWCPSGRSLWFIQWWSILSVSETLCQIIDQTDFQLPNCEYKCNTYTTSSTCNANSSYCDWVSRNNSLSCSSFNQTTCQSTNGCDWVPWTPVTLGTCTTQICGNDIKEWTELCDGYDLQIPCTTTLWKVWTKYCNSTCNWYTTCVADPTPPSWSTCVPKNCFIADTKIKLADGSTKPIQEITTKDIVYSVSWKKNKVIWTSKRLDTTPLYAFNNSNHYFVTEAHPFLTLDGWKSLNPDATNQENPWLMVTKLSIWDILITEKWTTTLFAIDSIPNKQGTYVYNITVENTHDYYADWYAVHNKLQCLDIGLYPCDGWMYCADNASQCEQCPVGLCDPCTSTSQCPVDSYCHSINKMCRPSSWPVCAL